MLVEGMLLNKFGSVEEYPWRRGKPYHKWWSEQVKVVKRLIQSLKISANQLCWYIRKYRVEEIKYEDFGLLRWKVKRYFRYGNMNKFALFYRKYQELNASRDSSYVTDTKKFVTKENKKKRNGLMDLMAELESFNEQR